VVLGYPTTADSCIVGKINFTDVEIEPYVGLDFSSLKIGNYPIILTDLLLHLLTICFLITLHVSTDLKIRIVHFMSGAFSSDF
jgi:hypothetical protein